MDDKQRDVSSNKIKGSQKPINTKDIQRYCLVCDQSFVAKSRFNRICRDCNIENSKKYLEHTYCVSNPKRGS